MISKEAQLQIQVATYLAVQYPSVIFHSDYGTGAHLNYAQANLQRQMNANRTGYPDMFIAKPKMVMMDEMPTYIHGLFIELKKEGVRIYKKNGELVADKHIRDQAKMHEALRCAGYEAQFAVGFEEAKRIIDKYLK